jgi:hypothetical protein
MYQLESVPSSSSVHKNSLVNDHYLDCDDMTMDPINGGNNLNNNPNLASKQRLRWTHELHERFVDAVAQLGGPDRKSHKHPRDWSFISSFDFCYFLHSIYLIFSNIFFIKH